LFNEAMRYSSKLQTHWFCLSAFPGGKWNC